MCNSQILLILFRGAKDPMFFLCFWLLTLTTIYGNVIFVLKTGCNSVMAITWSWLSTILFDIMVHTWFCLKNFVQYRWQLTINKLPPQPYCILVSLDTWNNLSVRVQNLSHLYKNPYNVYVILTCNSSSLYNLKNLFHRTINVSTSECILCICFRSFFLFVKIFWWLNFRTDISYV